MSREAPRAAGGSASQDAGDAAVSEEVQALLAQWDLERHAVVFAELGVDKVRDLKWMRDSHIEELQIPPLAKCKAHAMLEWWREEHPPEPARKKVKQEPAKQEPVKLEVEEASGAGPRAPGPAVGGGVEERGAAGGGAKRGKAKAEGEKAETKAERAKKDPAANVIESGIAEHISVKVKGVPGQIVPDSSIVHINIKRTSSVKKLMELYCQRKNLQLGQVRFWFHEDRLYRQTPDELKMEDGDLIYAMDIQIGDIGEWGEHSERLGTRFLKGDTASTDDVRAILRGLGVKTHRMFESIADVGLDASARGALMQLADSTHTRQPCEADQTADCSQQVPRVAHSNPTVPPEESAHAPASVWSASEGRWKSAREADFKLQLSHAELAACVGEAAARRLDALFRRFAGGEEKECTVKIRRVEAVGGGRCINFHTDVSRRTMQVPLNNESDYDGGRLVFATKDGLVWPTRNAGSATLHDSSIAHGVSLHTRGVRYSLFFLDALSEAPHAVPEPAGHTE